MNFYKIAFLRVDRSERIGNLLLEQVIISIRLALATARIFANCLLNPFHS